MQIENKIKHNQSGKPVLQMITVKLCKSLYSRSQSFPLWLSHIRKKDKHKQIKMKLITYT